MTRILTGVKVKHASCGAILRQIPASKGSKGSAHVMRGEEEEEEEQGEERHVRLK